MSLLRRRMMMQTAKSGAKYPLVNGRHEFSFGNYVEVTNGNRVKFNVDRASYLNISNIFLNTDSSNNIQNINSSAIFFIPENSDCHLSVKNFQKEGNSNVALALIKSESTSTAYSFGNVTDDVDLDRNLSNISVGCLRVFTSGFTSCEFYIEFTVNGERWI